MSKKSRKKGTKSSPVLCEKFKGMSKVGNLKPMQRNTSTFPGTASACKYFDQRKVK